MANKIEYTDIPATDFVTSISRYSSSRVVYYSDEKIITFETYKKKKHNVSSRDQVAVITPGLAYRPDLVSQERYGVSDFWWKIMEVNNIKDIFEFKAGKTIVLPDNIYG
jgi:hypothetical protein